MGSKKEQSFSFHVKNLYPALKEGAIIHCTPLIDECLLNLDPINPEQRWNVINITAAMLLKRSDGSKSIHKIMQQVSGKQDADNPSIQKEVLDFFRISEHKRWIRLLHHKSTPQKIKVTGSFTIYYPRRLTVELTHKCNLSCKHCYICAGKNQQATIPTKQLLSFLKRLKHLRLQGIDLTGGEPLLHPDFFTILSFCIQTFEHVDLLTNGTLITEEIADKLAEYKEKLRICVSLDGSTAEIHNNIRGWGFSEVVSGIKNLTSRGLFVRVGMSYTSDSYHDIENTIMLAKKLGAQRFTFSPILPFGRGEKIQTDRTRALTETQIKSIVEIIEKHKEFITSIDSDKIEKEKPGCGAGFSCVVINPNGDVRPCILLPEEWLSLGNIFKKSPKNLFAHPAVTFLAKVHAPQKDDSACQLCKNRYFCSSCWVRAVYKNMTEELNCPWFVQSGIKKYLKVNVHN